jgi:hypothetical protein
VKTKATPQGTLNYTYDMAGNVASMASSNANGISVGYTYDQLKRLASVVDNRLPANANTTTYSYDPASNLATVNLSKRFVVKGWRPFLRPRESPFHRLATGS